MRTLAWIGLFSVLIEVGLSILVRIPAIENSEIGRYFSYGASIETKIRAMATDPDLPSNSVFYAGWLDPSTWPPPGQSNDVAVYGMSYAGHFADALRRMAPDLDVRFIGGPGAPLSHSYAAYGMDVTRRSAKIVVITLLPRGVEDMAGMTHDTGFGDHSQPATWPVYRLTESGIELAAWPVINSAAELRSAVTDDPALWQRHLGTLADCDANYHRVLYAAHWSEHFVIGRILRRAWAKSLEREWSQSLMQPDGHFDPETLPAKLTRGVLRAFIRDVRRNGEKPVVILFSQPGSGDSLFALVGDILRESDVPYLKSEDFCDSNVSDNYANLHLVPRCDDLMATHLPESFGADLKHGGEH